MNTNELRRLIRKEVRVAADESSDESPALNLIKQLWKDEKISKSEMYILLDVVLKDAIHDSKEVFGGAAVDTNIEDIPKIILNELPAAYEKVRGHILDAVSELVMALEKIRAPKFCYEDNAFKTIFDLIYKAGNI